MGFPNKKELDRVRKLLESADPSLGMPENPTQSQVLKYKLCEQFVVHLREQNMSQVDLARDLKIDTARLNEIVKYKIHLFTVDKLIEYTERLNPDLTIQVS